MVDQLTKDFSSLGNNIESGETYNPFEENISILDQYKDIPNESIDVCVTFFNNWNQLCYDREDWNLKRQFHENKFNIENLLKLNYNWIKDFLKRFTFIILKDCYTHVETCQMRSGIQHLLETFGDTQINGQKFNQLIEAEIKYIDNGLECWLNDHVESEIANYPKNIKSYPKTHIWWDKLSCKENLSP